ncbi:MAG: MMPL family transporter [Myxococcota bacterium]|nr:MMPL family transporter [Myxococcota bacterium]
MEKYARWLIRCHIPIFIIAIAVTIALGTALPRLYADDDVMQFLPDNDPKVQLFRRVNDRFGGLDVAIVGLETETLFTAERLRHIRQLTRQLGEIDGVFDVLSFTEAPDPRPSPFGLVIAPLVDQIPASENELEALKARVLANETAVGNLISNDGRAAMILCFLGGNRPPIHIAADIKEVAAALWPDSNIYYGGAPFIRLHIAGGTKEDLVRLTPVVALVVMVVTFFIFRRPMGVLLSLGAVGISVTWLMGALALRSKGVTVVGSALPTVLVAIGGAYGIHILVAYFSSDATSVRSRVIQALKRVGSPVLASTVTTCVGFLSFLAMDVAPLREFGAFAALGVAFAGVQALVVIPSVLCFFDRVPPRVDRKRLPLSLGCVAKWASGHRRIVLIGAVLVACVGLVGVARIAPDTTLKTFFHKESEPDRANAFLTRHFGGSVYLQIYFEGDLRSPFVLAELRKVVEVARGMPEVVQVSSIIDPLVMMSEAMGGRADLPESRERVTSLYPFLDGTAAIDQIVSPNKDAGLVQIRLKDIGPERVHQVVKTLHEFVEREIPTGIRDIAIHTLAPDEQTLFERKRINEVSKRIVRLVNILAPQVETRYATKSAIAATLLTIDWRTPLLPGSDLTRAIKEMVDEFIVGEAAPFEALDQTEGPVLAEWDRRAELAVAALAPIAGQMLQSSDVRAVLTAGLPCTAARDPEGLAIAVDAITARLNAIGSAVRAQREVASVLASIGIKTAPDVLKDRVAWAMTDLGTPVFGFPDHTDRASPVMAAVTGQPVVNVAFCNSTIRNQLRSLAVAFVMLLCVLAMTFKSALAGLKALIPPLFVLSIAVGVMGAASIPLDMTTSMIAAIGLGVGVDYSIHFLWRRRRRGMSLAQTTADVGPSVASNAVQVAAGFAVMTLSDMVPMQRFGLLVAITMLLSALSTFVLLPALRAEGIKPGINPRYSREAVRR